MVHNSLGDDHLRIEPRVPRDEPRERPVVVVRPVHHRRDAGEPRTDITPTHQIRSAPPCIPYLRNQTAFLSSSAHLNNGGRCFPAAGTEAELVARHGRAPGVSSENRPRRMAPGLLGASGAVSSACFAADHIAMASLTSEQ